MKLRRKNTRHEAAHGYVKRYQDLEKKTTATKMTKTDEKGRTKHGKAAAASMVEVSDEKERSKHGKAAEAAVVEVTEGSRKDE